MWEVSNIQKQQEWDVEPSSSCHSASTAITSWLISLHLQSPHSPTMGYFKGNCSHYVLSPIKISVRVSKRQGLLRKITTIVFFIAKQAVIFKISISIHWAFKSHKCLTITLETNLLVSLNQVPNKVLELESGSCVCVSSVPFLVLWRLFVQGTGLFVSKSLYPRDAV